MSVVKKKKRISHTKKALVERQRVGKTRELVASLENLEKELTQKKFPFFFKRSNQLSEISYPCSETPTGLHMTGRWRWYGATDMSRV